LRLRIDVPDRPGSLARLAADFAQLELNILAVDHHRERASLDLDEVEVAITVETRGLDHRRTALRALRDLGWHVHLHLDGPISATPPPTAPSTSKAGTTSPAGWTVISMRPADKLRMRSATRSADIPGPGSRFGQEVTMRHLMVCVCAMAGVASSPAAAAPMVKLRRVVMIGSYFSCA
jgi:hypothetical protein